jgi:hypothetical protein
VVLRTGGILTVIPTHERDLELVGRFVEAIRPTHPKVKNPSTRILSLETT